MNLFLLLRPLTVLTLWTVLLNASMTARAVGWIRRHPLGADCRDEFRRTAWFTSVVGGSVFALVAVFPATEAMRLSSNPSSLVLRDNLKSSLLFLLATLPVLAPALALHPRLTPQRRSRR